jgi:hypothetical protein
MYTKKKKKKKSQNINASIELPEYATPLHNFSDNCNKYNNITRNSN